MNKVDYLALINKYIVPESKFHDLYLIHATLVTEKALDVASNLALSSEQKQFIEEASMLHDIGAVKCLANEIFCSGKLDYIWHGVEGRKILESEGLDRHALVCERHTGVGITINDIESEGLPLPQRDMIPEEMEEKIISYADLFYTKKPSKIFVEKSPDEIISALSKINPAKVDIFKSWQKELELKHAQ
ncbi:phosphohydrolase [Patescibacteria group bacterium]|nr:phosphohydrolase [Patescibacteria group bacterium]